jgi:hypothetical protein
MNRFERPERFALAPALLFGLWLTATILATWAQRLTYPFNLEWMEGGVLAHAWRLQHFEPIYVEPSPDFIPMIYPPGYPALLALLGVVPGISHPLGRLISICGTLAAAGALVWGSKRQTGSPWWGLLSACIFIGMYPRSGTFYDLVRPDGISMGLLAWSIVTALEGDEKNAKRSGILLFLSFATKHNAAIFGFPLAAGLLVRSGWRPAVRFVTWAAGLGLAFTLLMQLWTGGLFTVWLLDVPASHPVVWDRVLPGALREMGHAMGLSLGILALWLINLGVRTAPGLPGPVLTLSPIAVAAAASLYLSNLPTVSGIERPTTPEAIGVYSFFGIGLLFIPLAAAGMAMRRKIDGNVAFAVFITVTAWFTASMMRGHHGGFVNVFIVLHWTTAALAGIALYDMSERLPPVPGAVLAGGLALAQTALLWSRFDSARFIPSEADRNAGEAMVSWLKKNADGPILSPFDPWLAQQAGQEPGFHLIALWDIRHPEGPFRDKVDLIFQAIREHHWSLIIDSDDGAQLGYVKSYEKTKTFLSDRTTMMPSAGWRARPNVVWTPKAAGAPANTPNEAPDEAEQPEAPSAE